MSQKRILITGTAGFIGFHLTRRLQNAGVPIVCLDNINHYYDPQLKLDRLAELGFDPHSIRQNEEIESDSHPHIRFIKADLENQVLINQLFKHHEFTHVIHLAAQAGVRYSIDHPHAYVDSNIIGFMNILEACRHYQVQHLMYASSSSVYGLNTSQPFSVHDSIAHPISMYAATKKANELMAHSYSHLYRIPVTGLRFFTVYGPWGRPDMAYFKFTKSIHEGRTIDVYNNGDMKRDFTYIDDVLDALDAIVDRIPEPSDQFDTASPDPGRSSAPYRVYNIGNNQPENLLDFIDTLETHIGKKADTNLLPMQPGDVKETFADICDTEADFGFAPKTGIDVGLKSFVEWFNQYYG